MLELVLSSILYPYQSLSGGYNNDLRLLSLVTDDNWDNAVVVRIYYDRANQPSEVDAEEHEIIGKQVNLIFKF